MSRSGVAASGCLLGLLLGAYAAQAQDVHKCNVNGQVTYQARPCDAADSVVNIAPGPSAQEQRDARVNLTRQRVEAATGWLMPPPPRPMPVAPPPKPAAQTLIVTPTPNAATTATTTTTTTIISNAGGAHTVIRTTRTTNAAATTTPAPAANNCDQLNRDNDEALTRRDQLQAPSDLTTRAQTLSDLSDRISRIQSMARATDCRLKR